MTEREKDIIEEIMDDLFKHCSIVCFFVFRLLPLWIKYDLDYVLDTVERWKKNLFMKRIRNRREKWIVEDAILNNKRLLKIMKKIGGPNE